MGLDIKGLREAQRAMHEKAKAIKGPELYRGMQTATLLVLRDAKEEAPVDTGQLRNSLSADIVMPNSRTVQGVVGSNVEHAPYMELGTKPHFPPLAALATWARRHGTNPFLVARAIATRGLVPRRYLQKAFEKNRERIKKLIGETVSKIVGS